MEFRRFSDGSIEDEQGREVFLGLARFTALARDRSRCFLCGIHENFCEFNDEHVVPDWVQKRFGLRNKSIRLWNKTTFPYARYKLRCCQECNTFLGKKFEKPLSNAIGRGQEEFSKWFKDNTFVVFLWINLVYLKMHLKDNELRVHRNLNAPDVKLGDLYDWSELHHCHALLRATRFGFPINVEKVMGSMFCLHLGDCAETEAYDYNDHLATRTVMIRLGSIAFITVLDDSCGVLQGMEPKLEKLPPNLNAIQLIEILSEFQFVSAHLKFRPIYMTRVDSVRNVVEITGILPEMFELTELDFSIRGDLMFRNIYSSFPRFSMCPLTIEQSKKAIKQGDVTFLA